MLERIEIEPDSGSANASVIWLHGLGASGDDFAPIVPQIKLDDAIKVRYIFPHAPVRPITFNGGIEMPAWYDFTIKGVEREINPEHLQEIREQICELIQQELDRGITSERIVLAGFSQGGAIAYDVALGYSKPLAGLMAMSTYIADFDVLQHGKQSLDFPVHIFHGTQDQVVPLSLGERAKEALEERGWSPQYSLYPMEHSVCLAQVRDITSFLNQVLC